MRGRLVRRTWAYDPTLYAPARYRRACSYEAFVPDPLMASQITLPGDIIGIVSDAERAIADLNRAGTAGRLAPLSRLLLRTESIASSKVEGLQIDARSLARSEADLDTGRKVSPNALEILANVDAMELAIERATAEERIEITDLEAIHRSLLDRDPRSSIAGRLRTVQNWIGGNDYNPCGADFVPPPPEALAGLLVDLREFCNDESHSPLVQAALAHAQFELIHPFEDGNGRTGRALIQIILRRRGLAPAYVPPISVMLARHRDRYIKGLTLFRENQVGEWIRNFAVAAAAAAQHAGHYLSQVAQLQAHWRAAVTQAIRPRSDAAVWAIIDLLPAHPVITISIGRTATGRTRPSVENAFAQLTAAGVLMPLSGSAHNRAWEAVGLLDLIVGLEAGE